MADAPWASRLMDMAELTTPMAIRVAATLRVADHILAGTTQVDAIAELAEVDPGGLIRVLRHLAAVDVLRATGSGHFELTDLGKELCEQGPGDPRSWLDITTASSRADLALVGLLDAVRIGKPVSTQDWGDLDSDVELSDSFDDQMAVGAAAKAPALIEGYDWSTVEHVVDVGGGNGTLLAELLKARPHLRGTVVDRPNPVEGAKRRLAAEGLTERTATSAQSFFDPLPSGGTVYLLSGVLHDWPDADAARILARCADAAGSSGRVLVMESLVEPDDIRPSTTGMDLMLLVVTGGRARSAEDLTELAGTAGLALKASSALQPPHSLLEFTAR
ncbi:MULTISPECIES: methyltransferase [unclassified Streptomyces]|uniref:methyltransferase n=1 Tax=unclassified Streptomyces TaxID=2593676 RepID=UPI003401788F